MCSSGSSGSWRSSGAAGESRSGRTGRPSCVCHRAPARCTPSGLDLVPATGRNRGRPSPVGPEVLIRRERRRRDRGRIGNVRPGRRVPGRAGGRQTGTAVSAGSTSVHDELFSAERATASSTSWTCSASAKEGAGSAPVAIASMKSRIWCVNECS